MKTMFVMGPRHSEVGTITNSSSEMFMSRQTINLAAIRSAVEAAMVSSSRKELRETRRVVREAEQWRLQSPAVCRRYLERIGEDRNWHDTVWFFGHSPFIFQRTTPVLRYNALRNLAYHGQTADIGLVTKEEQAFFQKCRDKKRGEASFRPWFRQVVASAKLKAYNHWARVNKYMAATACVDDRRGTDGAHIRYCGPKKRQLMDFYIIARHCLRLDVTLDRDSVLLIPYWDAELEPLQVLTAMGFDTLNLSSP